jgi:hypothetical protein
MGFKGWDKLKGLLPERFQSKAAPVEAAPPQFTVPLLTLAAAILPVMEASALIIDHKNDIARGWRELSNTITKLMTTGSIPANNDYVVLRNNVAAVASEIEQAPRDAHVIPVPAETISNIVKNIGTFDRIIDDLLASKNALTSSNVASIRPSSKVVDYPAPSKYARTAEMFQKTFINMSNYLSPYALNNDRPVSAQEKAAQPRAGVE